MDLPGYGYASVARSERGAWRPLVEGYLRGSRKSLRGALLLVDARRELAEEETELRAWLAHERIACKLVFTKTDKLAPPELRGLRRALAAEHGDACCAVSARTGEGLGAVAGWLRVWLDLELRRPDGTRFR